MRRLPFLWALSLLLATSVAVANPPPPTGKINTGDLSVEQKKKILRQIRRLKSVMVTEGTGGPAPGRSVATDCGDQCGAEDCSQICMERCLNTTCRFRCGNLNPYSDTSVACWMGCGAKCASTNDQCDFDYCCGDLDYCYPDGSCSEGHCSTEQTCYNQCGSAWVDWGRCVNNCSTVPCIGVCYTELLGTIDMYGCNGDCRGDCTNQCSAAAASPSVGSSGSSSGSGSGGGGSSTGSSSGSSVSVAQIRRDKASGAASNARELADLLTPYLLEKAQEGAGTEESPPYATTMQELQELSHIFSWSSAGVTSFPPSVTGEMNARTLLTAVQGKAERVQRFATRTEDLFEGGDYDNALSFYKGFMGELADLYELTGYVFALRGLDFEKTVKGVVAYQEWREVESAGPSAELEALQVLQSEVEATSNELGVALQALHAAAGEVVINMDGEDGYPRIGRFHLENVERQSGEVSDAAGLLFAKASVAWRIQAESDAGAAEEWAVPYPTVGKVQGYARKAREKATLATEKSSEAFSSVESLFGSFSRSIEVKAMSLEVLTLNDLTFKYAKAVRLWGPPTPKSVRDQLNVTGGEEMKETNCLIEYADEIPVLPEITPLGPLSYLSNCLMKEAYAAQPHNNRDPYLMQYQDEFLRITRELYRALIVIRAKLVEKSVGENVVIRYVVEKAIIAVGDVYKVIDGRGTIGIAELRGVHAERMGLNDRKNFGSLAALFRKDYPNQIFYIRDKLSDKMELLSALIHEMVHLNDFQRYLRYNREERFLPPAGGRNDYSTVVVPAFVSLVDEANAYAVETLIGLLLNRSFAPGFIQSALRDIIVDGSQNRFAIYYRFGQWIMRYRYTSYPRLKSRLQTITQDFNDTSGDIDRGLFNFINYFMESGFITLPENPASVRNTTPEAVRITVHLPNPSNAGGSKGNKPAK